MRPFLLVDETGAPAEPTGITATDGSWLVIRESRGPRTSPGFRASGKATACAAGGRCRAG